MSYNPIDWTSEKGKKIRKEMRRIIKNYNARLKRAIERNPENAEFLPERKTLESELSKIGDMRDFNVWKRSAENFTAETAKILINPYGVKSTVYQVAEAEKARKRENTRRKKARAQKQRVFVGGQEVVGAQRMNEDLRNKPLDKGFQHVKTSKEWVNLVKFYEGRTNKKLGETDPQQWREDIKKALHAEGITDPIIVAMYNTLDYESLEQRNMGHLAPDLDFIYDLEISFDSKVTEIREDLLSIIESLNRVDDFIEKMKLYVRIDERCIELWDIIGNRKVFELYKLGVNILQYDEILAYINADRNLQEKYNNYLNQKND